MVGKIITYLVTTLIIIYTIYILVKNLKQKFKGKCGSCSSCPHEDNCPSKKE
ncbi:hypothetical protein SH2C18_23680 [Clostridium sediminicola]|uniref:FeoB-associated Cys-rich membrane protein n=1 Tax=Clostridium sediminicola TaxID=3114879 RepID=UPI0031F1F022